MRHLVKEFSRYTHQRRFGSSIPSPGLSEIDNRLCFASNRGLPELKINGFWVLLNSSQDAVTIAETH
jgi:hypothetical protein